MRELPEIVGRDMSDALVIRTDFSDDESWDAVVGELSWSVGAGREFPGSMRVVDAPVWSGAIADEVLAAVDKDLSGRGRRSANVAIRRLGALVAG